MTHDTQRKAMVWIRDATLLMLAIAALLLALTVIELKGRVERLEKTPVHVGGR